MTGSFTATLRVPLALAAVVFALLTATSAHAAIAPRSCSAFELDALRFQPPHVHSWRSLAHVATRTCGAVPYRYRWVERQSFLEAARLADTVFPGTYWWLRSCSESEGGWWSFVMNTQGSGAGGWMQFIASTFAANAPTAIAAARARGLVRLPAWTDDWYSKLGQAITAAWMYPSGRTQWSGVGC